MHSFIHSSGSGSLFLVSTFFGFNFLVSTFGFNSTSIFFVFVLCIDNLDNMRFVILDTSIVSSRLSGDTVCSQQFDDFLENVYQSVLQTALVERFCPDAHAIAMPSESAAASRRHHGMMSHTHNGMSSSSASSAAAAAAVVGSQVETKSWNEYERSSELVLLMYDAHSCTRVLDGETTFHQCFHAMKQQFQKLKQQSHHQANHFGQFHSRVATDSVVTATTSTATTAAPAAPAAVTVAESDSETHTTPHTQSQSVSQSGIEIALDTVLSESKVVPCSSVVVLFFSTNPAETVPSSFAPAPASAPAPAPASASASAPASASDSASDSVSTSQSMSQGETDNDIVSETETLKGHDTPGSGPDLSIAEMNESESESQYHTVSPHPRLLRQLSVKFQR
jgi:hypothetical protein